MPIDPPAAHVSHRKLIALRHDPRDMIRLITSSNMLEVFGAQSSAKWEHVHVEQRGESKTKGIMAVITVVV